MSDDSFNAFHMAQHQFDEIAARLGLDDASRTLLRQPDREFQFNIPVRMDDGGYSVFRGFRVQHNDSRGPIKGGIRFHPQESLDNIRARAMWMTWKSAVVDIPVGGGDGGVVCDLHNLSMREQEGICRGWVRKLFRNIGPLQDVAGPDVMTLPQHMLWMLDEYETVTGKKSPGFITGKPLGSGGSLGRIEATGYGVIYTLREALGERGISLPGATASVQGFGNVGRHAVELFRQYGGTVTCISCWDQSEKRAVAFRKAAGIDPDELLPITNRFGEIAADKARDAGYEVLPGDAWLEQDVTVLIPAALENQINGATVGRLRPSVKVIAEAASGPTTPDADRVIQERGIVLIPDLLANAGGVTCNYFEQVQSNMNYYWSRDEVLSKLDMKLTDAYFAVSELAHRKNVPLREAAYMIAVSRVAEACKMRGWV